MGGGELNEVFDDHGTIGGGGYNQAGDDDEDTTNSIYATVSGGVGNKASGNMSVVGGGGGNRSSGDYSTVGGGMGNHASGEGSTIAGGGQIAANVAEGSYSAIGGGDWNNAGGNYGTVGGGFGNAASGDLSTVPGGLYNSAAGDYSFAAGRRAQAQATHDGAFVWADSNDFDFASTAIDEFSVRATGGVRFVTAVDGAGAPTAGVKLDPGDNAWEPIGARVGRENVADGVALAAIQRLQEIVQKKDAEIAALKARMTALEEAVAAMVGNNPSKGGGR